MTSAKKDEAAGTRAAERRSSREIYDEIRRRICLLAYPGDDRPRLLRLARDLSGDPAAEVSWAAILVRGRLRDASAYPELVDGLRRSFAEAADAVSVLLQITGGSPNHGLDYEAWKGWVAAQAQG